MCHDRINPVTPHLESFSPLLGSFLFPKHYPIYVHVFENILDFTYEREHVYLSFWVWFVWVSKMVSNLHGFLKIMQHWSSWTKFQCVCWGYICLVSVWGEGSSSIFAVDRLENHRDILTLVPSILESTGKLYTSSGVPWQQWKG